MTIKNQPTEETYTSAASTKTLSCKKTSTVEHPKMELVLADMGTDLHEMKIFFIREDENIPEDLEPLITVINGKRYVIKGYDGLENVKGWFCRKL